MGEEGIVETWEYQGGGFTNVGRWVQGGALCGNVVRRTGFYQVDKYLKEFYINGDNSSISSIRIIAFYSNVNGINQVDIKINNSQMVSLNGTNEDTLLKSPNEEYLCIVDFHDFINYKYQADININIASNINLNPSIKSYLGLKAKVDIEKYQRLVGSFFIDEEKDISKPNALFYLPFHFEAGQSYDVKLDFSEPLTSSNVLICTSTQKSLADATRMDIMFLGNIADKSELTYTLQVTQEANFFTFYTQMGARYVAVKMGCFKNAEIGKIKADISGMKTGIEELRDNYYFKNNKWKAEEVVTCGYNRNYSNLYDAMQYAKTKAGKDYIVEIQLYSDIIMHNDSQLRLSDKYEGSDQYRCVCNVPPYVRLRGIGSKKVIALLLSSNSYAQSITETLHVDGNSELENLHIIGYNLRYPIHFERGNNIPNIDSIVRMYNVDITHHGASQWQSPEAWGSGNASGMNVFMYGCRLTAIFDTLFAHNWNELSLPVGYHLYNCSIVNTGEQKVAIHFQDSGSSKQPYMIELIGNNIDGYVKLTAASSYKLIKSSITGYGNSPHYFKNEMTMENIRIRTKSTGITQFVIEKTNAGGSYLGNACYETGAFGRYAYVYWDNNLTALPGNDGTLLGKRLGDCSFSNKSMKLVVNNEEVSIMFDKNYTNHTNQQMVDEINSKLSGKAVAEIYQPLARYYEELSDVLYNIRVVGPLNKGTFVDIRGNKYQGIEPYAMLIDDALYDEIVVLRVIRNCIISKSDQFAPLFEKGSDVFVAGDRFIISASGKLEKDNLKGKIVAIDSDKILFVR